MPLPEFTPEEQFFINYMKSQKYADSSYTWGYVLGVIAVFAFGVYYDVFLITAGAFIGIILIYELSGQAKWAPLWHSIINKYESAPTETDRADPSPPLKSR